MTEHGEMLPDGVFLPYVCEVCGTEADIAHASEEIREAVTTAKFKNRHVSCIHCKDARVFRISQKGIDKAREIHAEIYTPLDKLKKEVEDSVLGGEGLVVNKTASSISFESSFNAGVPHGSGFFANVTKPAEPEGRKDDKGKPRPSLLPFDVLYKAILPALEHGAHKYGRDNWKIVPDGENRYLDAMFRHLLAHLCGERIDEESGLPHIWMAATNMLFYIWFLLDIPNTTKEGA